LAKKSKDMAKIRQKKPAAKTSKSKLLNFFTVHWQITLSVIVIGSGVGLGLIWFNAISPNATEAKMKMPAIIPLSFDTAVAKPFGGPIKMTIDCSTKISCLQNPICTIVNCILQIPFIFQVFDNKAMQVGDAFEVLREEVLEPQEKLQCEKLCDLRTGWYRPQCILHYICDKIGFIPCYCKHVLPQLQKQNVSPVGLQTQLFQKTFMSSIGMTMPAFDFILFPDQGLPACNATGNILGQGFGQAVFFNIPGGLTPVGDSCRGSYYFGL